MLKLAALAAGSWRWLAYSALAAGAAAISIVIYQEIHANPTDKGTYGYQTLGRERVLLMNVDKNTVCPITYESYVYNQDQMISDRRGYATFWTWVKKDTISLYNLKVNSHTELHVSNNGVAGDRLWSLLDCRHGNTHSSDAAIQKVSNYLPFSGTSYGITKTSTAASNKATADTAGQIVMRNTPDAQVVSSCYPDGIGTVYFDAVNAFTEYPNGKIAVEVAYGVFKTNLTGQVESRRIPEDLETDADGNFIPPDEAHCDEVRHVEDTVTDSTLETTPFGRVAWVRANLTGVKNLNGAFTTLPTKDIVELNITAGTTTTSGENFYRVWAPIADPAINPDLEKYARGPLRFRIKRADDPKDTSSISDISLDGTEYKSAKYAGRNALLLVDNVIASYPPMKAWAIPQGEYVPSGKKNVIGWTGAVSPVKYPAVGATGLKAAAGLAFATNNPAGAKAGWIGETKASMTYRWRYMDQIIDEWKQVPLTMQGDHLVSADDFELTNLVGDVEFKYDVTLDAPYYSYLDYSGSTKFTAENPTPGYLERIAKVTSAFNPEARGQGQIPLALPSGGTDFFFRLRAGRSDQLELQLEVRKAGTTAARTNALWLVSDGTWKTYLKTTTNATSQTALTAGDYEFRVIGLDPQKVFGGSAVTEIPWSGKPLSVRDEGAGWTAIRIDPVTGALMFQVMESEESADLMTYSIVRADYQDFALWSDAVVPDGRYTGAFFEGKGKQSGSSPDARPYPGELPLWNSGVVSNAAYWTEGFKPDSGKTPEQGYGDIPAYQPFEKRVRTPNGWQAWNAQWVCAKWRESAANGNLALQLGGDGSGGLEFTSVSRAPRGVDTLTLKARIAQMASFENFVCYYGKAMKDMHDYVVTTRAMMSTTDASTDFDGAGSVSLVGYYQLGKGCYELRAVRIANDTIRLYLYKWTQEKKVMKATLLGCNHYKSGNNWVAERKFKSGPRLQASNALNTSDLQASAYFSSLFMRCRTVSGKAVIEAGIMNGSDKKLADSCTGTSHDYFTFTDSTAGNPLTFGTFGFGSLNCPAKFISPKYYASTAGSYPAVSGVPTDSNGVATTLPNFKCGTGTVSYPDSNPVEVLDVPENIAINDSLFTTVWMARSYPALEAVAPKGELELFTRNAQGSGDDEVSQGTQTVSGFKYNDVKWTVRNHEDTLLRLSTADESDDIVVDDVSFDQWCASSYDDQNAQGNFINADFNDSAKMPTLGCPTNWVYMNGWVTVNGSAHAVDLQPARVKGSGLVEIRAPLMDGLSDDRDHPENKRGIGLGQIAFNYKDADEHCVIRVQYAPLNGASYLREYTATTNNWIDAAVIDFGAMTPAERKNAANKPISVYVGQHGFQGVMRVLVDPGVVKAVVDDSSLGADYGKITITDFRATDEPPLDGRCWWGWNIRTTHDAAERSLDDSLDTEPGLAAALNNSVTDLTEPLEDAPETEEERKKRFAQHVPFVQSPTFATNIVGEISFKARKLRPEDPPTEVAVLGAKDGGVAFDSEWKCLKVFVVSNAVFSETYSYKTKAGDDYASFRLAVIGLDDVAVNYRDDMKVPAPRRVLIDDVAISEAVRGKIAFMDIGAFRDPLDKNTYVTNLFEIVQQPMCEETWSVQCEVYAAQLKEEVRIDTAEVKLHWYSGEKWGYEKWKNDPAAKSAPLARIDGLPGRYVFRGSYEKAAAAMVDPSYKSGTVVQYMLEVDYRTSDGEPQAHFMELGEWKKPEWYRGVDYNATRGGFAGYTILDSVAYGYAWINEVNFYDGPTPGGDISTTNQYVEVAVPSGASVGGIDGWKLQFITGGLADGAPLFTNTVVTYRDPDKYKYPDAVPCRKTANMSGKYAFITAGSPDSCSEQLARDGIIDGPWHVTGDEYSRGSQLKSNGRVDGGMPIGVRLVRPSGIVEHEIVISGTNRYATSRAPYPRTYSTTNFVLKLDAPAYVAREDTGGANGSPLQRYSSSVTDYDGVITNADVWAHWPKTPGRINANGAVTEAIPPQPPHPQGSMVVLNAKIANGHVSQTIGDAVDSTENLVLYVPKNRVGGTNIVYEVDFWYEVESIVETEDGKAPRQHGEDEFRDKGRRFPIVVADDVSNDVTVVVTTRVRSDLANDHGLKPENPYTPAVLSWLSGGMRGPDKDEPFENQGGAIHRTKVVGLNGAPTGHELDLTSMYWLDIDPTKEGMVLKAAMCDPPEPITIAGSGVTYEDVVFGIQMEIYNELEADYAHYAPYTLNGLMKDGVRTTSMDMSPDDWDSETFKVTGYLNNGRDEYKDPDKVWMPLRYFVFDRDSFDANFKAKVQVRDPFFQVDDWMRFVGTQVFFKWHIDSRRFGAWSVEVLRHDSTYSDGE